MDEPNTHAIGLLGQLAELPETLFGLGVGVVALLALLGLLSWHRHRTRDRNSYRLEQRALDNTLALRRDVYLPAAEAIARAQDFLGKFPGKDWTREQGSVVVDYVNGAMGKVNVVGSERTIKSTMAVATEFSVAYLTLSTRRHPINDLQYELEHLDSKISHMTYERDQLLAQITRIASEGLEGQGIWNDLNLRFDKLHRQIAATLDERAGKVAERNRLKHALALEAAESSLRIAKLAVPAYLAIREELEMPIDDEEYRALAHSSIGELEHALARLRTKESQRAAAAAGAERSGVKKPQRVPQRAREEQPHERNLKMVLKRQ